MLVAAAAERWGVAAADCRTESGAVLGPGGKRAGYGELVAAAAKRPLPDLEKVELKDPKRWRLLGTSVPRRDVPAKVDGSARFGLDVRVPGMLYAVVARCPTFGGKPKKWDALTAKAVPGVRQVFEIPPVAEDTVFATGGIAVVADSTWAAIRGREALDVEWDHGPHAGESSAAIAAPDGRAALPRRARSSATSAARRRRSPAPRAGSRPPTTCPTRRTRRWSR